MDRSRSSWCNPGRRALVWSLRIGASLVGLTGVAGAEAAPGIVVDSVTAGYAASMGGVREGDILLSWQEQGGQRRHGTLVSPLQLADIGYDVLPRGPVTLEIRRGARLQRITLEADPNGLSVDAHPALAPESERLYQLGRRLVDRGATREGVAAWRRLAGRLAVSGPAARAARCSVLAASARAWGEAKVIAEARAAYAEAYECAESIDLGWVAALLEAQAWLENGAGSPDVAEDAWLVFIEIQHERAPSFLARLHALAGLHEVATRRGEFERAQVLTDEMLERARRDAPGSLLLAQSALWAGQIHILLGEHAAAEELLQEAAALAQRVGPDSVTWSWIMGALGVMRLEAGSVEAERYFRLVYERQRRWAPVSVDTARALVNLGGAADANGDIGAAAVWFRAALGLAETPQVRRLMDDSMRMVILAGLGRTSEQLGRWPEAMAFNARALQVTRRVAPNSHTTIAELLSSRGRLLGRLGRPRVGLQLHFAALDECEAFRPGAAVHGRTLLMLGDALLSEGDAEAAAEAYARALSILEATPSPATDVARARAGLARVARRQGRLDAAELHLRAAVERIEGVRQQEARTDEERALFAAGLYGIYQELVGLLAGQDRAAEAFTVLEQGRARALLALLAERRLPEAALPPELEAERTRLEADYDRAREALGNAPRGAASTEAEVHLAAVRTDREALAARIRQAVPGVASFRYPEPLAASGVARRLDPGTLLIAYSVGPEGTLAFALSAPGAGADTLRAVALPVGAAGLRRRIMDWRRRVESDVTGPAVTSGARALYDLLLRPLAPELAAAERVIVVPDGPLHGLPFAALHDGAHYVAETTPLSVAPSGTLAAQWMQGRQATAWKPPVLFADAGDAVRGALPGSRREVAAIAERFPGAIVHVGAAASEVAAKALPGGARFVHFAVHGVIDVASPLDSGLALHGGVRGGDGRDNGLLQAWEIVERVRLDTDLVTLSACRSADGPERSGEGTMGLVRAFQYAGARSVLASLWFVDDHSSATFMRRFYAGLAGGASKASALSAAQRQAVRDGWPPSRWASFQLYGDWK